MRAYPGNMRCCRKTENAVLVGGIVITAATLILGLAFSRHLRAFVFGGEGVSSGVVRIMSPAADAAGAGKQ